MIDLAGTLFAILLTDIVNPVLFAFLVYAVGSDRPLLNSSALLIGHTAAYFMAGVILAIWLEAIMQRLKSPEPVDYGLSVVIGMLLVWFAFRSRSDTGKRPEDSEPTLTPVSSFFYGAIVNFVGIPFAVPYFAALGQIMQADLSAPQGYAALVAYNVAYALPFLIVPGLRLAMGEASRDVLQRINARIEQVSALLMPLLLGLLGAALIVNAAGYFIDGEALLL